MQRQVRLPDPFVDARFVMKKTCVFLGSKDLGLSVLKSLYAHSQYLRWIIIHPDDTSDQRSCLSEFNNFARLCDLDIMVAANATAAKQMISDIGADIGFVCGWYWLLDAELLDGVPQGLWGGSQLFAPALSGQRAAGLVDNQRRRRGRKYSLSYYSGDG